MLLVLDGKFVGGGRHNEWVCTYRGCECREKHRSNAVIGRYDYSPSGLCVKSLPYMLDVWENLEDSKEADWLFIPVELLEKERRSVIRYVYAVYKDVSIVPWESIRWRYGL